MTTLALPIDTLTLELADGRTVSALLAWYPRLLAGCAAERDQLELIGDGKGVRRWLAARAQPGAAA